MKSFTLDSPENKGTKIRVVKVEEITGDSLIKTLILYLKTGRRAFQKPKSIFRAVDKIAHSSFDSQPSKLCDMPLG